MMHAEFPPGRPDFIPVKGRHCAEHNRASRAFSKHLTALYDGGMSTPKIAKHHSICQQAVWWRIRKFKDGLYE